MKTKTVLVVAAMLVVGFALIGKAAQTDTFHITMKSVLLQDKAGQPAGRAMVSGNTAEQEGAITHMSGGVDVLIGTAHVIADEAVIDPSTHEVELRGTVRVSGIARPPAHRN